MPSHNIFRNKLHLYSNVHKEIYDDDDKIVEYFFLLNCILLNFCLLSLQFSQNLAKVFAQQILGQQL